jgi:putative sterol carrier protein
MEEKRDLTVSEFTEGIGRMITDTDGLDARIKIVFDDSSVILIDGKSVPARLQTIPMRTTLKMSLETFNQLYRRELNPAMAAMTGKIRIEGDLMKAMKLEGLLRG